MARDLRIVLICDRHMDEKDERVENAATYTLNGQTIELCADCAEPVIVALDLLDRYGVGEKAAKRRQLGPSPSERSHCPLCDWSAGGTRRTVNLRSHVSKTHQRSLAQALGEDTPYPCPYCPMAFVSPTALGTHRRHHSTT